MNFSTLDNASDSPVSEELSTFKSEDFVILMSAGIFWPSLITITSPTTNLADKISFF